MSEETLSFDYSRIFYAASAFFAILAVMYFGFEYLQNLSPFTIAAIIFSVFAAAFIRGTSRQSRGVKFVYYLLSAGSYTIFLIYINARLIHTDNGVLASLIISALLFSGIGYLLTNREDLIPNSKQSRQIYAALGIILALIILYDIAVVGYEQQYSLEEQVTLTADEEIHVGVIETEKTGYLPVDVERNRANYCTTNGTERLGLGGTSYGGYTTGYMPETREENLTAVVPSNRFDQIDNFEQGTALEVVEVETCARQELNVSEGELGVEIDNDVRPSGGVFLD